MLPSPQKRSRLRCGTTSSGFSLLEMLFATVILLAGLVGIAQLVPASILLDHRNRMNSSSVVFAQRELDQMLEQPFTRVSFLDSQSVACNLGDSTQPDVVVGNPVLALGNNPPLIDFGASPVTGYSFTYADPNDPYGATFDVRWAVITRVNGSAITSRRFILGVRQVGGTYVPPVTLDSMVSK